MDKFIDANKTLNDGVISVNEDFVDTLPTSLEESGLISGVLQFVDSLGVIKKFIGFIVNIVFTPLGLFVSVGMSPEIVILVGIPLLVMMWLGAAYFIRSGG